MPEHPMPTWIAKWAERIGEQARRTLLRDQQHAPLLIVLRHRREPPEIVMCAPWPERRPAIRALCRFCAAQGVAGFIHVYEAWTVTGGSELDEWDGIGEHSLGNHPDRVEMLIVAMAWRGGNLTKGWRIARDATGRITATLPRQDLVDGHLYLFEELPWDAAQAARN